ncbi:MAG: hypothetical protein ACI8XW_003229, partial [Gammaproteobacteria bacterium]
TATATAATGSKNKNEINQKEKIDDRFKIIGSHLTLRSVLTPKRQLAEMTISSNKIG